MATALQESRRKRLIEALEFSSRGLTTRELGDRTGLKTNQAYSELKELEKAGIVLGFLQDHNGKTAVLWRLRGTDRAA